MINKRFLELAFNHTFTDFQKVVSLIPPSDHIIIEAGTPLIKREGVDVIRKIRHFWKGQIMADLKIIDGAEGEVEMVKNVGADLVTASGGASLETLRLFVKACKEAQIKSVIDMLNIPNPMKVLWKANVAPDGVFIHRGRDEENSYGKIIQYKEIAKIKGKWDIWVGAAGGIDKKELQSAIFNGADIVVINVVKETDPWKGIVINDQFRNRVDEFLKFLR